MHRPQSRHSHVAGRQHPGRAPVRRALATVACLAIPAVALFAGGAAQAQSSALAAQFDGGIGVNPATWVGANNAAPTGGAAAANNVNDTPPAGRPWGISELKAEIFADGSFDIRGKGLIFTGGPNVGRSGNANVRARLYCGPAGTLGKLTSEEAVQLATNGDFRLRGQFAVVNQPLQCPNAVLLILNAGQSAANAGGWFAAGIPKE